MDYQKIINEIVADIDLTQYEGKVADYIPELGKISPDKFGVHLNCINSGHYFHGDSNEKFSIQSIAKVLTLTLAAIKVGDKLLERVDVEPSGDPFNSLTQLEYENGIPRNPLINAGALVVCDILLDELNNPKEDFLTFVRKVAQNPNINYNLKVAKSEEKSGFRNAALVNYMKSFGNIRNRTEDVLDLYFHTCSIEMTCKELSETFMLFANRGCLLGTDGVGGGIAAVHPGYYSVVVWSPKLNPKGNSTLGMRVLELLTTKTELSVF